jgi:hypothetical protein
MWVTRRAKPQAHCGIPKCTREFLGVLFKGAPIGLNVMERVRAGPFCVGE